MSLRAKLLAGAVAILALAVPAGLALRSLLSGEGPSCHMHPAATGCERPPLPPAPHGSPHAGASSVTIQVTAQRRQAIDGWGGSIVTNTVFDPQARPQGLSRRQLARLERLVYRKAGINLLRVFGPGFPRTYIDSVGRADDGQGRLSAGDGRWRLMKRGKRQDATFLFTASNAPASMKRGRRLAHGSERAFARYIAYNLSFAKRLGVPFDFVAIGNEIDNADASFIPLLIGPEQAARVYDFLAGEILRRRLPTRLALGDNINWDVTLRYASAALRYPRVRRLARVLASHSYGGDESRAAIGDLARRYRLKVWMTEWEPSCPNGECREVDMHFALQWAGQIIRDLQAPGASAWFLLRPVADSSHGAETGIIVRTRGNPTSPWFLNKQFYVFRQFTSAAPPGSRRFAVRGSAGALAFRKGRRLSVVATNSNQTAQTATLRLGAGPGRLLIRRTSDSESFERLAPRPYDGRAIVVSLSPQSVTTFTLVYPRG